MASADKNIVIVGGGIIGCSTAYFLTRHPSFDPKRHKITVLESTKIAGGASGKAGGLLALWAYPGELVPLSYRLHKELAEEHGGAKRWGYRAVHCGQVDCKGRHMGSNDTVKGKDHEMDGGDGTALNGDGAQTSDNRVSLQKRSTAAMKKLRAAGVPDDLDWVDPDCLSSYDHMGDPSTTAQVHPYLFTTSMADLARDAGADIKVGARVKSIKYNEKGDKVTGISYINKEDGQTVELAASDVVVSAGPWTSKVYPSAPIAPLRAHSVTIKPTRLVSPYCLFTSIKLPAGFGQTDEARRSKRGKSEIVTPEIYARQTEIYACGEGDRLVPLPESTDLVEVDEKRCQDVVDYVCSISDELRDGEVTARQACYLPNVTRGPGHPMIGPTKIAGLWMCAGHTCWGIQNGPGSGKLMSEFVFDGAAKSANIKQMDPRLVL
ncbi:FAD dependent oxidoreductase [Myriangium duriaei CBS 260.36]|uniref:FAD dependent oxidoreductase n=1 Tax=Myriangium duriaei CBS 260.36 TaxID=1168546 RepID=A0A9P4MR74_9PEZI|nr:FAD dependent oxidoreductase [Myriangium duriaei CBS 260.36]